MTFLEDIFSRHAVLHKCVTINKSGWKSRQSQTDAGLFMRRNVSISRNRTKIERLFDWKEFTSKSVGRFSFQCLTVNIVATFCNFKIHTNTLIVLFSSRLIIIRPSLSKDVLNSCHF